jgi:hypothetical protein
MIHLVIRTALSTQNCMRAETLDHLRVLIWRGEGEGEGID